MDGGSGLGVLETGQDPRDSLMSSGGISSLISGRIVPFALREEGTILAPFGAISHKILEIVVGCETIAGVGPGALRRRC